MSNSKTSLIEYIRELISLVDSKTNILMNSLAIFAAIISISIKLEILKSDLPLDTAFDGIIVFIFIYYIVFGPYLLWRQKQFLLQNLYVDKPNYEIDYELIKISSGFDIEKIQSEINEIKERSNSNKNYSNEEKLFAYDNSIEKLNDHLEFAKNLNSLIEKGYYAIYFKIRNIGGQTDEFLVIEIYAKDGVSFVRRKDIDKKNFLKKEPFIPTAFARKPYINKKLRVHSESEASIPIRRMQVGDKATIPNGHPLFFKTSGDNQILSVEVKSDNLGRVYSKEIELDLKNVREVEFEKLD